MLYCVYDGWGSFLRRGFAGGFVLIERSVGENRAGMMLGAVRVNVF